MQAELKMQDVKNVIVHNLSVCTLHYMINIFDISCQSMYVVVSWSYKMLAPLAVYESQHNSFGIFLIKKHCELGPCFMILPVNCCYS